MQVFIEKLYLNYHQIPTLAVPLSEIISDLLQLVRPKSENKLDTAVDLEDSHEQTQEG